MRELLVQQFLNEPSVILDRISTLADALKPHLNHDPDWITQAIEAHMTGNDIPEYED